MAKATFNWSEIDRSALYSLFYSLHKEVVGKELTPTQLQKYISKHIKAHLPVKIKKFYYPKTTKGYIFMGGMYDSDFDKKSKPAIEINFNYNPEDSKIKLSKYRWSKMAVRFADIVLHEIIHMRQFRARNFKPIPGYQSAAASSRERKEQEYYGDNDEMGAFSFNIACEMIDMFGYNPGEIGRYMDSNLPKRHKNTWWAKYLKTFEFNHNHQIIQRMKRKVLRDLENAYNGKPFKTSTHLTY
jgi:hypothetical protein